MDSLSHPSLATNRPVILTRPGAANDRLADLLQSRDGISAWRWPAFRITLPPEQESVSYRLSHLDNVEMVILPSPSAVAAVSHWVQYWPKHITLATVGEGTARVIRAAWGDSNKLLFPKGDAKHSGSEALFALMQKEGVPMRVLILRGQTGREWLPEQLSAMGADVETLCTYLRLPLELSTEQEAQLRAAVKGPSPILYITSSDAVGSVLHALRPVEGAREWLTAGSAITIHPRCAEKLTEAGFTKISITAAEDEPVRESILKNLSNHL